MEQRRLQRQSQQRQARAQSRQPALRSRSMCPVRQRPTSRQLLHRHRRWSRVERVRARLEESARVSACAARMHSLLTLALGSLVDILVRYPFYSKGHAPANTPSRRNAECRWVWYWRCKHADGRVQDEARSASGSKTVKVMLNIALEDCGHFCRLSVALCNLSGWDMGLRLLR